MKFNTVILIILLSFSFVKGQVARKYSNEFLTIGVGAKSLAMANSSVAGVNSANAVYWNPAGLLNLDNNQLSLMHSNYFANIAKYDYVGFAKPLQNNSVLGLSIIRFGVDDILNTTQLIDANGNIDYNRIELFSTADYAFTLSYARFLGQSKVQFGGNLKVIKRQIGDFADSFGVGFDLGLMYKNKGWSYGFMLRDATTTYNSWTFNQEKLDDIVNAIEGQNQEIPEDKEVTIPKLQVGVNRVFPFKSKFSLETEVNLAVRFVETNDVFSSKGFGFNPSLGLNLGYENVVFLRGGIGNVQKRQDFDDTTYYSIQPNTGIGLVLKGIKLDYAFTNIGKDDEVLFSHVFSMILDWKVFAGKQQTTDEEN